MSKSELTNSASEDENNGTKVSTNQWVFMQNWFAAWINIKFMKVISQRYIFPTFIYFWNIFVKKFISKEEVKTQLC